MAILSFYECQILVDGVALQEYDNDDTEDKLDQHVPTEVKYVQASSGAEFSIKFKVLPGWDLCHDFCWQISLDGNLVGAKVVTEGAISDGCTSFTVSGVHFRSGQDWHMRRFRFADIVIGDVANQMSPNEVKMRYSDLGVICVRIRRYKMHRLRSLEESFSDARDQIRDVGTVPEKALKGQALSLSTSLGVPKRSTGLQNCEGQYVDELPVAIFQFKYRSKTALQQLMILPRSPTPVPLEDRPIEDLTAEEARELLRRQKSQGRTSTAKIKTEGKSKLKRERSATNANIKPAKIARRADGREYIDLVSDSDDGGLKDGPTGSVKDIKKTEDKVEIIDLLN